MSAPLDESFRIPLLPWIGVFAAIVGAALPWVWFDTTLVVAILAMMLVFSAYSVWVFRLSVRDDGIERMTDDAMKSGNIAVNPRTTDRADIIALYRAAL